MSVLMSSTVSDDFSSSTFKLSDIDIVDPGKFTLFARKHCSDLSVPDESVGVISKDSSAVVGMGNWCFIYDGFNNYRNAYNYSENENLGLEWANVIERRASHCNSAGVKFLQVIIPNKLSLLSDFFPQKLSSDVTFIAKKLLSCNVNAPFLMPIEQMRSASIREYVFRRNDSHLSLIGNLKMLSLVFHKFDIDLPSSECGFLRTKNPGDLGSKFEQPLVEQLSVPNWNNYLFADLDKNIVLNNVPINSLNGTHQVFNNKAAPFKLKLVVFGNSFFEKVPSWGLSPYFAALFEEFHFVWGSHLDMNYCRQIGANMVIAQTCERFMSQVPNDIGL